MVANGPVVEATRATGLVYCITKVKVVDGIFAIEVGFMTIMHTDVAPPQRSAVIIPNVSVLTNVFDSLPVVFCGYASPVALTLHGFEVVVEPSLVATHHLTCGMIYPRPIGAS